MHIIRGIQNMLPSLRGGVITIGNFDGVHLGHQTVFDALRQWAADLGGAPTLVLTFEPHPQRLLGTGTAPERVTNLRGKARWIKARGMDALLILRFTRAFASQEPAWFVRHILVEALAIRAVMVGDNFRFGAGGQGTFADLQTFGQQFGFDVRTQPLLQNNDQTVSSTRIRALVKAGHLTEAAKLLGRSFEMEARVTQGQKRGRKLGFPTANVALAGMLHPPPGVYVVEGWVDGHWLPAVANLGHNPTFGKTDLHLEVHILAKQDLLFEGILYRQVMRVRFLQRLRDEITFPNSEALKQQIAIDVFQAQTFFAHH